MALETPSVNLLQKLLENVLTVMRLFKNVAHPPHTVPVYVVTVETITRY